MLGKVLFFTLIAVAVLLGLRRLSALKSGVRGFLREYHAAREGRSDIEITARPAEARPAEARPAEARPAEARPAEARDDRNRSF